MEYKSPFLFDKVSFWKTVDGYCMQNSNCKVIKLTKKQAKELELEKNMKKS